MVVSRVTALLALALLVATGRPALAQVDFSGEWRSVIDEGRIDEIGDYTGMPINADARLRADSWDAAEFTLPERQCRQHPLAHLVSPGNAGFARFRWWKVIDPVTQATVAYQIRGSWMEPERTIWMDGRPHPSEYAPHTWMGFSTGRWEGNSLRVTTTHLKEGYVFSNGLEVSDRAVVTEILTRHGNYLASAVFVEDPVYLTEPLLRTRIWVLDSGMNLQERYPCGLNEVVVEVIRPKGEVPHHLPGANPYLREFAQKHGLPLEATRGGAETLYPEYVEKIKTMTPEPVAPPPLAPGATRNRRPD
jgi:hypothetical protein